MKLKLICMLSKNRIKYYVLYVCYKIKEVIYN